MHFKSRFFKHVVLSGVKISVNVYLRIIRPHHILPLILIQTFTYYAQWNKVSPKARKAFTYARLTRCSFTKLILIQKNVKKVWMFRITMLAS